MHVNSSYLPVNVLFISKTPAHTENYDVIKNINMGHGLSLFLFYIWYILIKDPFFLDFLKTVERRLNISVLSRALIRAALHGGI